MTATGSLVAWSETPKLYQHILQLLTQIPNKNGFVRSFADGMDGLLDNAGAFMPSVSVARRFVEVAGELYQAEDLTAPAPWSSALEGTLEGALYRDKLLALHKKIQFPETALEMLRLTITNAFLGLVEHIPVFTIPEEESRVAAIPIVDVADIRAALAALLLPFSHEALQSYALFSTLRSQLAKNILELSGGNEKRLISPTEYKGRLQDAIHAYLKNTPLEKLFSATIPFEIPQEARFSGHWIIAPPGRGKTVLLSAMFLDDLPRDASIIIMDSKGDLIEPIKKLQAVADRLVLIEPDPEFPLALNPLDIPHASVAHTISLLEYVMSSLLEAKMTPLQTALFRKLLPAFVEAIPNPTLETFRRVLIEGVAPHKNYLAKLPPDVFEFYTDKQHGFDSKTYAETRSQLVWRLDFLLSNPILKSMFASLKTKLDIGKEMDAGKIILINNSKALLGDEGSEFFGRFFIALILAAAQQRAGRPSDQKLPVYCYIDECHNVIARDPKIATILDECRSQKIALILAHQRSAQLTPPVLDAVVNCGIRFANSDDEAKFLADKLRTTTEFLYGLSRGTFAAFIRDLTPHALALKVPYTDLSALPQMTAAQQNAIRDRMRAQYSFTPQLTPVAADAVRPSEDDRRAVDPPRPSRTPPPADPHTGDHTKPATSWGDD